MAANRNLPALVNVFLTPPASTPRRAVGRVEQRILFWPSGAVAAREVGHRLGRPVHDPGPDAVHRSVQYHKSQLSMNNISALLPV